MPQKLGALERPGASLMEVRAYFDGLVSDLMSPEGRVGCLMVNTTVELAAEDSEVASLTRAHMARLERSAERALRTARARGEIPAAIDPAAKATQLMATGMGLMVVGKTDPEGGAGDDRQRRVCRPRLANNPLRGPSRPRRRPHAGSFLREVLE